MRRVKVSKSELHPRLVAFPMFQGRSEQFFDTLVSRGELVSYEPGEIILEDGQPATHCYALLEGAVRVFYTSEQGARVLAKLFTAPAFFAEENFVDIPHLEDADAMTHVEALRISRQVWFGCLFQDPELMFRHLVDVAARFMVAAKNEKSLAFQEVPARLATLFLSYAKVFGAPVSGGVQIARSLTQDELADGLGATRKSVQRTVHEWMRLGILGRSGKFWLIRDEVSLRRISGTAFARLDYSPSAAA